jgi:hypothetical protein
MSTTIQIKKKNRKLLDLLKKNLNAETYDEVIEKLLSSRLGLASDMFGVDRGKISRFTEKDRLESER